MTVAATVVATGAATAAVPMAGTAARSVAVTVAATVAVATATVLVPLPTRHRRWGRLSLHMLVAVGGKVYGMACT